ncbi:aminotransferase class I/II-fold pyridoxal phosphate-dependent enzyme [Micromonospora sp. WMMD998]|uniref:aminotransferase class I/II-fold pyridoxal phosphate-dependent enzyme n=1 Tax=Micromonospora sp. WMMD998 TaxID=3016092 RepID=UPI00249AA872|nr:aminotransferase class I/II-fold pyridoxal phosphate-dependent enzyme [Micromonospora sp. WMMD998]WFE37241.1 aminotransferase class I/II-fold pyridoxal phosphate-dependent enzyme [Micromonospora sp. WMMD998]
MDQFVLVGGSGFLGTATADALLAAGAQVTTVDRHPPAEAHTAAGLDWIPVDLLTDDPPELPPGIVVVLLGASEPRPRRPWTLPLDNAVSTARLLPRLAGRRVVLTSSVEVYGAAAGPLTEDTAPELPWTVGEIDDWCARARELARTPCPPWRSAPLARVMADADPTGRWTYAMAKLAQERLVAGAVDPDRLTVLRLANVVGAGQHRVATRLVRRARQGLPLPVTADAVRSFLPAGALAAILLAGIGAGVWNVGGEPVPLTDLATWIRDLCGSSSRLRTVPRHGPDSSGLVVTDRLAAAGHRIGPLRPHLAALVAEVDADRTPLFRPPLPVVVPPPPANPELVAARQQEALASGEVKHGNRWTRELTERLGKELELDDDHRVLVTASGTAALRIMVAATVGPARPGDVAVLPSYTFPATAEILVQLGYALRFADVDAATWTLDPAAVATAIGRGGVRVVLGVDTFGNPCDYPALRAVCDAAGVALLADSAAALGSLHQGRPVAQQALAHSYSMSFAKVVSAGGAGGALVLPADAAEAVLAAPAGWTRSELMNELHAVVAVDQLAELDTLVRRRAEVAEVYADAARHLPVEFQQVRPGDRHCWVHWVALVAGRDRVAAELAALGVQTKPYFAAIHRGPLGGGEPLPVTDRLDAEALALPMSSELTVEQAERVVAALRRCLG